MKFLTYLSNIEINKLIYLLSLLIYYIKKYYVKVTILYITYFS